MSKSMATLFHCPVCAAKYEVVGFEAPPGPATEVMWRAFAAAGRSTPARANSLSNTS
jgi:hypothetical protein